MKTIKSALLGNRQLDGTIPDMLLSQLKEIIKEHRARVITSLRSNIPTYVDYKFERKTSRELHAKIKDELIRLQDAPVDLEKYTAVTEQLMNRDAVHLTNEPFYKEIDECLAAYVADRELKLA